MAEVEAIAKRLANEQVVLKAHTQSAMNAMEQAESLLRAQAQRVAELEAENRDLRGLVQCHECSEELGNADYHGWMPGMCLGCQAEAALGR